MNTTKIIINIAILSLLSFPNTLFALKRELILFQDIPVVTIASKKSQSISESPIPVIVINEEEIRLSGASNVPEVLQRIAGIDVLSISASDHNVSIRGFNMEASDKVLVMIDGRSVYLDFYGIVLWDAMPVSMEEIKRIEIIKGPGSSIHGGNAFNGVINIITKSPEEINGTILSMSGGKYNTFRNSIVHGRRNGDFGYRISLSRDEKTEWEEAWNNDDLRHSSSVNILAERHLDGNAKLSLSGGLDEGRGETMNALDNFIRDTKQGHIMLDYRDGRDLNVKIYMNNLDTTVKGESVLSLLKNYSTIDRDHYHIKTSNFQSEITKLFKTDEIGDILLGINYSRKELDSYMFSGKHRQEIYGIFLEDEFKLSKSLNAIIGGRYDRHPFVGTNLSPRLGLVYSHNQKQRFRFSYATAYHLPTFVNSYLAQPFPAGNKDLKVEKIKTLNVGFSGPLVEGIEVAIDIFRNEVKNFIRWPNNPVGNTWTNREDFHIFGGELGLKTDLTGAMSLIINYSYFYAEYDRGELYAKKGDRFKESPEQKINLGFSYETRKLYGSLFARYVSETAWPRHQYSSANIYGYYDYSGVVDSHTTIDLNMGYNITNSLSVAFKGRNILNDNHREFPMGDKIGPDLSASIRMDF